MTPRRGAGTLLVCLAVSGLLAPEGRGQGMDVPADLQHGLFLRTLSFDRRLERMGDEVVIGVLYQAGHAPSAAARAAFMDAADRSGIKAVEGRRVVLVDVPWVDGADVVAALIAAEVDVVYLAPLRSVDVRAFASAAGSAGILTLTGVHDYLGRGVALGVTRRDGRARLLVDLEAARLAGSEFAAQLLKLAEVLE